MATDDTKPAEHPAPWAWAEDEHAGTSLVDANSRLVAHAVPFEDGPMSTVFVASPYARELIRLAPEMADLVRELEWSGEYLGQPACPRCNGFRGPPPGDLARYEGTGGHANGCRLAAILAALDAARAA